MRQPFWQVADAAGTVEWPTVANDDLTARISELAHSLESIEAGADLDALRKEIADIAAKMVAVVAQKEGMSSSLREMLAGKPQNNVPGRTSPANRAASLMHQE